MPFNSNSGKHAGRKSSRNGVPNKDKSMRDWIATFIEDDRQQAVEDWQTLTPFERWRLRTKLHEYITPKLNRTEHKEIRTKRIGISKMFGQNIEYEMVS